MYKKTNRFIIGSLITVLLSGCATTTEETITDISNMTIGEVVTKGSEVVSKGVDTSVALWNGSKEMLQNLDTESLVYVSKLAWYSAPLAVVYVELNLLYINPETYNPNEWTTLFERNHQRIVDTKANIEGLTPTPKLEGLHDSYVSLLTHTINLNEKVLKTVVEKGSEITAPLVEEFQSLQSQYEEINSLLEMYNN